MKKENNIKKIVILITVLVLLDQISKIIAYSFFKLATHYEEISNNNISYIIISIIVVAMIIKYISSNNLFIKKDSKIILSFAIAGAISNVIDRVIQGHVINFIKIGNIMEINLAYIYIIIAWIGMAVILTKNTMNFISKRKENK